MLHNEEFNYLFGSLALVRIVKARRKTRNAYRILVGK
jgi:hypothetical protein